MISNKIKECREKAAITQNELAEKLGLGRSVVSKYETGLVSPSLETLQKIASALNVTVSDLLPDNTNKELDDLAINLKAARKRKGLTQVQLADVTGLSIASIRKYETGERNPRTEELEAIAKALDIDIRDQLEKIFAQETFNHAAHMQQIEFALETEKFEAKERLKLIRALNVVVDYVNRSQNLAIVDRLSNIILRYGEMLLQSWEMRFDSKDNPHSYYMFLHNYQRCLDLLSAHKEDLIKATLDSLDDPSKLRELIYGKDDPE